MGCVSKVLKLFKWFWKTLVKARTRASPCFECRTPEGVHVLPSGNCDHTIPYHTIVGPYQGHISRRSGTRELSRFLRGDNTQIQAVTPVWWRKYIIWHSGWHAWFMLVYLALWRWHIYILSLTINEALLLFLSPIVWTAVQSTAVLLKPVRS